MSSQIDVTKPASGTATTQSVRDNFSSTVSDIEALQGESSILGVAASVAANALTVALKTSAGIDATSTTGVEVSFRNATASTGTRTVISAEAALSVVAPQGATLGFANSATDNIYAYAINNAGTVELAISAALLDEGTLQSTTAISASADSATVLYSTTARSNVGVRLLGRIKITTGATAGDWGVSPSEIHASNNFQTPIPTGLISMWSGSNASIPSGWLLCDGTLGTPNLIDRFIVASGSTYATGATGGADSVNSAGSVDASGLSAGATTLSIAQMPSHDHQAEHQAQGLGMDVNTNQNDAGKQTVGGTSNTGGGGSHIHAISGSATFTGSSTDNRPAYFALAYIMKS